MIRCLVLDTLEGSDKVDDYAPHLKVIASLYLEHGIVRIGRSQFNIPLALMRQVEVLDGKLTVPVGHDDGAVMRFHRTVDDDPVTIEDASILHRVTLDVAIERGFWMPDIVAVEVQRLMDIVLGR